MLELFDTYASLFKSWHVVYYEQEGEAYLLHMRSLAALWNLWKACAKRLAETDRLVYKVAESGHWLLG